jgi:hypothetical protein
MNATETFKTGDRVRATDTGELGTVRGVDVVLHGEVQNYDVEWDTGIWQATAAHWLEAEPIAHRQGEPTPTNMGWDGRSQQIIELVYPCGCHFTRDDTALLHSSNTCLMAALRRA